MTSVQADNVCMNASYNEWDSDKGKEVHNPKNFADVIGPFRSATVFPSGDRKPFYQNNECDTD